MTRWLVLLCLSAGALVLASDRVSLDLVYQLLSQGGFDEAKAEWKRVIPQLQATLGGVGTEAERRERVGEAQFVQGPSNLPFFGIGPRSPVICGWPPSKPCWCIAQSC